MVTNNCYNGVPRNLYLTQIIPKHKDPNLSNLHSNQGQGEKKLTSFKDYFKAYSKISRLEYVPGVVPGMFLPVFIGASSISIIFSMVFIEAILVFALLYFSGFIINSLADREIDKKYNTFKGGISEAVDLLGENWIKMILLSHVGFAILLSFHIAIVLQNPWIVILVLLGVLFGLGYSVPPFNFKVKGPWHAIALASSAFFLPLTFLYIVVAEQIQLSDIILITGITIAHYSMEMANQAADHLEDSREGLLTPTVRMGLDSALRSSVIMTSFGVALIISVVSYMYISSGFTELIGFGAVSATIPALVIILFIIAIVIIAGYYIPLKGLRDLLRYSTEPISLEERVSKIKQRVNYAGWQASGIIGVVITLGILFSAGFYAPVTSTDNDIFDTSSATELDINTLRIANVVVTTHNEGESYNYADVMVRLSIKDIEQPEDLKEVMVLVDAGTANEKFATAHSFVDTDGRANIQVSLLGNNETKVWYYVYLFYDGQQSRYSWTVHSTKNLYIFDAKLETTEGLLYDHFDLTVSTFNAGPAREPNSLKLRVEWSSIQVSRISNNITINMNQEWKATLNGELLKEFFNDGSVIKIYLSYEDKQMDVMEIRI